MRSFYNRVKGMLDGRYYLTYMISGKDIKPFEDDLAKNIGKAKHESKSLTDNVYSEDEVEEGNSKYTKNLAIGISIILLGVVIMMLLLGLKTFGEESTIPVATLMYFVTIGVLLIIYSGKMKEKFDIEKYNNENTEEYKKVENKIGRICGVIMLITTIIFLVWGFTLNMWYINWVVYPVGGILCGIVGTIFKKDNT